MSVKFLDLYTQYHTIQTEIKQALDEVLTSCAFTAGPFVKNFEQSFAKLHNVPFCVGVNNGTSALHIVLMALNIGHGDEVIVPANTFFATAEAVSLAGATPVFVDCEDTFYNIDTTQLKQAITSKTKAVMGVHLYGQPANLHTLKTFCDTHQLHLIEDCAQAHLATYQKTPVGNTGIAGCFSFYPGKNLGAYGDAGAVITHDEKLYNKLLALRDHGSHKKYHHDYVGHNYRMSGFQGAVLNVKAQYIRDWTQQRIHHAQHYDDMLQGIHDIVLPQRMTDAQHVFHLYAIQAPHREDLIAYLNKQGIQTGIHYPIPCHLQKAYQHLGYSKGDFPVTEYLANRILSLPMYPELNEQAIATVCQHIRTFYG